MWAAQDPDDPTKLKGMPIPAEVIERFRPGPRSIVQRNSRSRVWHGPVAVGHMSGGEDVRLMTESLTLGFDLRFADL